MMMEFVVIPVAWGWRVRREEKGREGVERKQGKGGGGGEK